MESNNIVLGVKSILMHHILSSAVYSGNMGGFAILGWISNYKCAKNLNPNLRAEFLHQLSIYGEPPNQKEIKIIDSATHLTASNIKHNDALCPNFPFTATNAASISTLHVEYGTYPPFLLIIMKVISMTLNAPPSSYVNYWSNAPLPGGSKSLSTWIHVHFADEFEQAPISNPAQLLSHVLRLIKKTLFAEYISNSADKGSKPNNPSTAALYLIRGFHFTAIDLRKLSLSYILDAKAINTLSNLRIGAFEQKMCHSSI